MFNPFKSLGDLKALRDQALKMQQSLSGEKIVVEGEGIEVVMSGDQKLLELRIDGVEQEKLKDAINEAIRKSQEIAAKKLTEMARSQG